MTSNSSYNNFSEYLQVKDAISSIIPRPIQQENPIPQIQTTIDSSGFLQKYNITKLTLVWALLLLVEGSILSYLFMLTYVEIYGYRQNIISCTIVFVLAIYIYKRCRFLLWCVRWIDLKKEPREIIEIVHISLSLIINGIMIFFIASESHFLVYSVRQAMN